MQNQTNVTADMVQPIVHRPIIFSAAMVRALKEGRKTQTRRVVKGLQVEPNVIEEFTPADPSGFWGFDHDNVPLHCVHSPYGEVGERLWVRETAKATASEEGIDCIHYMADDDCRSIMVSEYAAWRKMRAYAGGYARAVPSIHMPRWASRITLEITGLRVERLQGISREDAMAEGIFLNANDWWDAGNGLVGQSSPEIAFRELWASINGAESWITNPWVWVVEFRLVQVR